MKMETSKPSSSFWKHWLEDDQEEEGDGDGSNDEQHSTKSRIRRMKTFSALTVEKKPVIRKNEEKKCERTRTCLKTSIAAFRKNNLNKLRPLSNDEENPNIPRRLRMNAARVKRAFECPLCYKDLRFIDAHLTDIHGVVKGTREYERYIEQAAPASCEITEEECDIIEFYNLFLKHATTKLAESTANVSARLVGDVLRYGVEKGLLTQLSGNSVSTLFSNLEKRDSYLHRRNGTLTANYKKKVIFACKRAVGFMTATPNEKWKISQRVGLELEDVLEKLAKTFTNVELKERVEAIKKAEASLVEEQNLGQLFKSPLIHKEMQQAAVCLEDETLRPLTGVQFVNLRDAIIMTLMLKNLIRANVVREFRMDEYEMRRKVGKKWLIRTGFHMAEGRKLTSIYLDDDEEKALRAYVQFARTIVSSCSDPKCYVFISSRLSKLYLDENCCLPMELSSLTNAVKRLCKRSNTDFVINPRNVQKSVICAAAKFVLEHEDQLPSSLDQFGNQDDRPYLRDVQNNEEQVEEEEDLGNAEIEWEETLKQDGKSREKWNKIEDTSSAEEETGRECEGEDVGNEEREWEESLKQEGKRREKWNKIEDTSSAEEETGRECEGEDRGEEREGEGGEKNGEGEESLVQERKRKRKWKEIEKEGSAEEDTGRESEGVGEERLSPERKRRKKGKEIEKDSAEEDTGIEREGEDGAQEKEEEDEDNKREKEESLRQERKRERKLKKQRKKEKESEWDEKGEGEGNALIKNISMELIEEQDGGQERGEEDGEDVKRERKMKKQRKKEKRLKESEHNGMGEGNTLIENLDIEEIGGERNAHEDREIESERQKRKREKKERKKERSMIEEAEHGGQDDGEENGRNQESEEEVTLMQERKREKKLKKKRKKEKSRMDDDEHGRKGEREEEGLFEEIERLEINVEEIEKHNRRASGEEDGLNSVCEEEESLLQERKREKKLKKQRKKEKNRIKEDEYLGKGEREGNVLVKNINGENTRRISEAENGEQERRVEDGGVRDSEGDERKREKKRKKQRKKENELGGKGEGEEEVLIRKTTFGKSEEEIEIGSEGENGLNNMCEVEENLRKERKREKKLKKQKKKEKSLDHDLKEEREADGLVEIEVEEIAEQDTGEKKKKKKEKERMKI